MLKPWVILGAILIGLVMFAITVGILAYARPPRTASGPATVMFLVIQAPTATPLPPTQTVPPSSGTPQAPSGQPGVGLAAGQVVQVTGTGGEGLRVRSQAGLDAQILFLGSEGEYFEIKDGPQEKNGYSWWYLVSTSDPKRNGWAVANFLTTVQNP